jgi:hypothetical protein
MSTSSAATGEYLALRRALGFKLIQAERITRQLHRPSRGAGHGQVTTQAALKWATLPRQARPW